MRLIRALAALALLKAGYWMIDRADGLRADKSGFSATRYHPAEAILLSSLVGLAICFVWIAATWRAWQ